MLDKTDLLIIKEILNAIDPISSEQIAFSVGKSSRTVRERLKSIDAEITKRGAKVVMKPGVGISILIENNKKFSSFLRKHNIADEDVDKDFRDLIQHLVFSKTYVKSEALCQSLLISRTKLSLLLTKLRRILKQYDLSLDSKPHHGIKIVGTEINLRRFISSYYVQESWFSNFESSTGYDFGEYASFEHEADYIHQIQEIVTEEIDEMKYSMPSAVFKSLVIHLFITVKRIKQGMSLNAPNDFEVLESSSAEYILANRLIERVEKEFQTEFPEYEHTYITMHLVGKKVLKENDKRTIPPEVNELVNTILTEIYKAKKIDLLDDFDLRMMLGLHLVPLLSRIEYGIELKNPILDEVKSQCIAGYDLAIICGKVINKQYNTDLSEHELSYFAIHFDVSLYKKQEKQTKKRVLIICSSGRASAQLLKMKFERLFSEYISHIVVCDLTEIHAQFELDSFDYVFSTVPIDFDIGTSIPVFEFSFFLDDTSVKRIESVFNADMVKEDLSHFFSENRFFPRLKKTNREDVLSYMIEKTSHDQTIPSNFESLVWDRELFSGTDILDHAALPHPAQVVTEETFVSVAILDEPILWESKMVQIVFLVSISKYESERYKMLLEKIVEITSSPQRLQNIIRKQSYEALMNEIKNI